MKLIEGSMCFVSCARQVLFVFYSFWYMIYFMLKQHVLSPNVKTKPKTNMIQLICRSSLKLTYNTLEIQILVTCVQNCNMRFTDNCKAFSLGVKIFCSSLTKLLLTDEREKYSKNILDKSSFNFNLTFSKFRHLKLYNLQAIIRQ